MTDLLLVLWCSLFALLGSIIGGFSGLVPGFHPNTLAAAFSSFPQLAATFTAIGCALQFSDGSGPILLGCFLIGILAAHSLSEVIPTAMLGVVDDETLISQLPSQMLYNLGRADLVIESTIIGGLGAVLLFAVLLLPTRCLMGQPVALYAAVKPFMGLILISICCLVLVSSRNRGTFGRSMIVFSTAGLLGIAVLTSQLPTQLSAHIVGDGWKVDGSSFLLAAFSGMFALPSLVFSNDLARTKPRPRRSGDMIRIPRIGPVLRSMVPSVLVGWMPGITNAYATSLSLGRRHDDSSSIKSACTYLITYSATNVGGNLQSILAMSTIFRSRNGTLEAINNHVSSGSVGWFQMLDPPIAMLTFLWAACIGTVFGAWLCSSLGRRILLGSRAGRVPMLRPAIISFIMAMVIFASGPVGLIVLFSSFLLGSWTLAIGAPRIHLMGFLLVPVIVYFMTH